MYTQEDLTAHIFMQECLTSTVAVKILDNSILQHASAAVEWMPTANACLASVSMYRSHCITCAQNHLSC